MTRPPGPTGKGGKRGKAAAKPRKPARPLTSGDLVFDPAAANPSPHDFVNRRMEELREDES